MTERSRVIVDYALRAAAKPSGVAEFRLTEALPEKLKGTSQRSKT
ncbi:MAG: hypothetical protein ACRD8O_16555 [Bryobacteraceae bacterium]